MISLEPFWHLMKQRGISKYDLEYKYELNPADISRLKNNHNYTLSSINRFCEMFSCQPSDILLYVDSTFSESKKQ